MSFVSGSKILRFTLSYLPYYCSFNLSLMFRPVFHLLLGAGSFAKFASSLFIYLFLFLPSVFLGKTKHGELRALKVLQQQKMTEGEIYAQGANASYQLGLGEEKIYTEFSKIGEYAVKKIAGSAFMLCETK